MERTAERPVLGLAPGTLGVATGTADLWCTYAALRTLSWLGRLDTAVAPDATAAYLLGRRNPDGGYAWDKGMTSDAWATFYCTQALSDLGCPVPCLSDTAAWLSRTWSGDAYAMVPGQTPDVWATHFSTRTTIEVCGSTVPDSDRLLAWLAGLQTTDGGLTWSPEHDRADVRATYYGVAAWQALCRTRPVPAPWDVPALLAWLRGQQRPGGGFAFGDSAELPCLWATYRACAALRLLDSRPVEDCVGWITSCRTSSGAFVRWHGYDVADVWASFCAVGALNAVGASVAGHTEPVVARLAELSCPGGGYTYREPARAADVLTTAATALRTVAGDPHRAELRGWLAGCQLPNEGGLMYMPARGAEVRCTLWGLAAGALTDRPAQRDRVVDWLGNVQNPDGGFGCWEGRGSDLVSTAAAVECVRLLDQPLATVVDIDALGRFLDQCAGDAGYGNVPGATPTLRAGLQALRVSRDIGCPDRPAVWALLDGHRVVGGGYANEGNRLPDLLSSYEAVVTADRYGIDIDPDHVTRFLRRVGTPTGTAWSPLAPTGGGPLADALGSLLRGRTEGDIDQLPALTLS